MKISAKLMAVLREHVRAESEHDMAALLAGMTSDCFNDVAGVPKPFVGSRADGRALPQALGGVSGFHRSSKAGLVR
jgi:hypothetical protein